MKSRPQPIRGSGSSSPPSLPYLAPVLLSGLPFIATPLPSPPSVRPLYTLLAFGLAAVVWCGVVDGWLVGSLLDTQPGAHER
uniref:Uncharacterized protein n=1 Tax=Hordeum vulgare subsp. vulgare TaxID=112509 RepID=A0A8I6YL55_HORVV